MQYLAGPYSHVVPYVREVRYNMHRKAAIHLTQCNKLKQDYTPIFSPILTGHNYLPELVQWNQVDWMNWCMPFLKMSTTLILLQLPGWSLSKGTLQEIEWASSTGLEIIKLRPEAVLDPESLSALQWITKNHNLPLD